MTSSSRINYIVPFILLFMLFGILGYELFYSKPHELPSTLIGEKVPSFTLPILNNPNITFNEKNLTGRVSLLTVWSSWCYACTVEAPMLMKIKNEYHVDIYSIDYKDEPNAANEWLKQHGNPFILTGSDRNGDVAIDFGVYGTPETFVINPQGEIVYRHIGVIDQQAWDEVIYPIVKRYS